MRSIALCLSLVVIGVTSPLAAQKIEKNLDVEFSETKWTTLLLLRRGPVQPQPIPAKVPLRSMTKLEFEGPNPGHPHLLSKCEVDGRFVMQNGYLIPEPKKSAALQLPSCDSFQLEGKIGLDGEGGWFLLFGWDPENTSGYCLYNTQLRTQGSPWRLCRIENAKMVAGSEVELVEEEKVNGVGGIQMEVVERELSLKILNHTIADHYALKDYQPGAIVFGTYKPRYGPKKMGLQSLRMKAW
ncbi:MAG: hypothetical protein HUJ26_15040 [Planctomycetaceae bacterium]|nr:hypothetical protein [Planctomycetaceae bacterium]